jgi:phosphoribosylaminoimidazolecarboxamide formyltransferase/IMP cyclohydrolase
LVKYVSSGKNTSISIKSTRNFLLAQEKDVKTISKNDITFKTRKKVNKQVLDDLIFGFIVSKFVNSNAIVLANNLSTLGIGVGQTNRLDSARQAIKSMKNNFKNSKAVMASDGFFPFPDIVKICSKNNIIAIIQPGGALKDDLIVEIADKHGIPMAFTGSRHFKH